MGRGYRIFLWIEWIAIGTNEKLHPPYSRVSLSAQKKNTLSATGPHWCILQKRSALPWVFFHVSTLQFQRKLLCSALVFSFFFIAPQCTFPRSVIHSIHPGDGRGLGYSWRRLPCDHISCTLTPQEFALMITWLTGKKCRAQVSPRGGYHL